MMSKAILFPNLANWEPTRSTLHYYSRAIGVIPRAHAKFHPKWWHISLKVVPDGLETSRMTLTEGGEFWLKIDLHQHKAFLLTDKGVYREFDLAAGLTATEFGDQILKAVGELGLSAEYAREKFENNDPREYEPEVAGRFLTALVNADRIFKEHRATIVGDTGPVQLWPHGFDLAFEWFGTRVERYEHEGDVQEYPSQLNLGFYPGDATNKPYFYSNPWPFEGDQLIDKTLPEGANWHTEGFEGSILPYEELAGDPNAGFRLREYARVVFELSSPTLMA